MTEDRALADMLTGPFDYAAFEQRMWNAVEDAMKVYAARPEDAHEGTALRAAIRCWGFAFHLSKTNTAETRDCRDVESQNRPRHSDRGRAPGEQSADSSGEF